MNSPAPVGTNFIGLAYSRLSGHVLTDPSLPVSNIHADINTVSFGYVHVFDLAGYATQFAPLAPFVSGDVSGDVLDAPTQVRGAR